MPVKKHHCLQHLQFKWHWSLYLRRSLNTSSYTIITLHVTGEMQEVAQNCQHWHKLPKDNESCQNSTGMRAQLAAFRSKVKHVKGVIHLNNIWEVCETWCNIGNRISSANISPNLLQIFDCEANELRSLWNLDDCLVSWLEVHFRKQNQQLWGGKKPDRGRVSLTIS